jgi:hypothetical protein
LLEEKLFEPSEITVTVLLEMVNGEDVVIVTSWRMMIESVFEIETEFVEEPPEMVKMWLDGCVAPLQKRVSPERVTIPSPMLQTTDIQSVSEVTK